MRRHVSGFSLGFMCLYVWTEDILLTYAAEFMNKHKPELQPINILVMYGFVK